jgi:hypothetical protein
MNSAIYQLPLQVLDAPFFITTNIFNHFYQNSNDSETEYNIDMNNFKLH